MKERKRKRERKKKHRPLPERRKKPGGVESRSSQLQTATI